MSNHDKKSILYVITKSNWGGAQSYVHTLATHFHRAGYHVTVALGGTGDAGAAAGELSQKLAESGVRTIFVKAFMRNVSLGKEWRTFTELMSIVGRENPDILHVNSSKAGGLGALVGRLRGVPTIVFTSHGLAYDEDRPLPARALIWLMTWITFLLCHKVIVISNNNAARARKLPFCRHKIHLVHNGISPLQVLPRKAARQELAPHEKPDTIIVGTIAELTRNKGLSYLIEATSLLKERGHSFSLILIGRGEERTALESLATLTHVSDRVHFVGFVPTAKKYLAGIDIFVLPSVKEGLPYVLLEAGQAGCAVVGSDIPGVTDIIDEHTGTLFPAKDVQKLANALEVLLTDPEKRHLFGERLQKKVAREFSEAKMFTEIEAVYLD